MLPAAVCVSGVVRLARFKIKDPERGQGGYAGLPITVNAGWVAMFVFISQSPPARSGFSLDQGWVAALFLMGIVLFILLQVSNVRYPKPTKNALLYSVCVVLTLALLILGQSRDLAQWAVRLAVVMIALGVGTNGTIHMACTDVLRIKSVKNARTRIKRIHRPIAANTSITGVGGDPDT